MNYFRKASQRRHTKSVNSRGAHGPKYYSDQIDFNTKNVAKILLYHVKFVSSFYLN